MLWKQSHPKELQNVWVGGRGLWITDAGLPPNHSLTGVDLLETNQQQKRKIQDQCKKKTLRMLKNEDGKILADICFEFLFLSLGPKFWPNFFCQNGDILKKNEKLHKVISYFLQMYARIYAI